MIDNQLFTPPRTTIRNGQYSVRSSAFCNLHDSLGQYSDHYAYNYEGIKKERDGQIDQLKFLLICLVVFGHVLMTLDYGRAERAMFNLIYSFHMPLFVFISGYFTKPEDKRFKNWLSTFRFLSLYTIFDILMWIVHTRTISLYGVLVPQYAMWYLLSMFYWRFMAMWCKKEWLTKRNLLLVVAFSAIVGFVPKIGELLSFNRTACFLCFFMAGMMCKNTRFFYLIRKVPMWLALVPFIVVYVFMLHTDTYTEQLRFVYSFSYGTNVLRFIERSAQMFCAVLLGLAFIRLSQVRMSRLFAKYGKYTLSFYLYHTFIIALLGWMANCFGLPANIWFSMLYTAIIIVICALLSKVKILNKFLEINLFKNIAVSLYSKYNRDNGNKTTD